ncbi:MAG: DUF3617 family protein [Nitrospinae bacterium]|nr:DUF3617 family protein [Nitrospinota bacterium]
MRAIRLIGVALGVGLLTAGWAMAQPQRPGMWEFSTQVKMPGMSLPPQTTRQCLTAQDVAERKQFSPQSEDVKCSMSNFQQQGNQVSYEFSCKTKEGTMTGSSKGTSTADTVAMEMTVRLSPPIEGMAQMTQSTTGKRVGDCK